MAAALTDFDCLSCGACCREAYHAVEVHPRDRFVRLHPEWLVRVDGRWNVRRTADNRCGCLGSDLRCAVYADRPRTCRDFEKGGENCLEARRRVGLGATIAGCAPSPSSSRSPSSPPAGPRATPSTSSTETKTG